MLNKPFTALPTGKIKLILNKFRPRGGFLDVLPDVIVVHPDDINEVTQMLNIKNQVKTNGKTKKKNTRTRKKTNKQ